MESKSDCNGREFGHCRVTWKIEKYNFVVWKETNEVETPQFTVHGPGSLVTSWKLILEHKSKEEIVKNISGIKKILSEFAIEENEESTIRCGNFSFCLQRCDSGQNTVLVDWRVRCSWTGKEESVAVSGENPFAKEYRHKLDLGFVYDFDRDFQFNNTLTFVCQMIVREGLFASSFDNSADIDLSDMSNDFKSIMNRNKFYDLELKFGEKSLYAHKAIFFARCKNFEDMSASAGYEIVLMPETAYRGMSRILEYVYSGDLSKIISMPSISMHDAILLMNLPELEDYFSPEEHKICTEIGAQELMYEWEIKNFAERDEDCLSSPILTNDKTDDFCKIHLYPRGLTNESSCVAVFVENIEGNRCDELRVRCAVLGEDERPLPWETLQQSTEENDDYFFSRPILTSDKTGNSWQVFYSTGLTDETRSVRVFEECTDGKLRDVLSVRCAILGKDKTSLQWETLQRSTKEINVFKNENFMKQEGFMQSLEDGLLILSFKITVGTGRRHIVAENEHLPRLRNFYDNVQPLVKLSEDMSCLRKTDKYTDITLRIGCDEIKAHKCILSARSRVLSDMFRGLEDDYVVLSDMKHEIVNVLLDYMYCAHVNVSDVNILLDVYKAAEKLLMSCLREQCSRILQGSLKLENVCDVLNLAEDYGDNLLKRKAIDFVQLNIADIRGQKSWLELKLQKSSLCKEIDTSLGLEDSATGQAETENVDIIREATDIKEKLKDKSAMSSLSENCSRILQGSLKLENVCDVSNLAEDYGDKLLKQKTIDFAHLKIADIRGEKSWLKLKLQNDRLLQLKDSTKVLQMSTENGDGKVKEMAKEEIGKEDANGKVLEVASKTDKNSEVQKKQDPI